MYTGFYWGKSRKEVTWTPRKRWTVLKWNLNKQDGSS
jgi:hypothetical protein